MIFTDSPDTQGERFIQGCVLRVGMLGTVSGFCFTTEFNISKAGIQFSVLTSCMTLGKLLNLSTQFSHLLNGAILVPSS